jgi:hypothetical protein
MTPTHFEVSMRLNIIQSLAIAVSPLHAVATLFSPTCEQGIATPTSLSIKVYGRA